MNSETLCEICCQTLTSPTILTCCYSSVCLDCLKKISVRETRVVDKLSYKCPFCNKEQQSYNSAKANTFLGRYIEFCYKNGKLQTLECGNCQNIVQSSEASLCKDCGNKYLCKECNVELHSAENTKTHSRTTINSIMRSYSGCLSKPMICSNHFREKIEFICLKDLNTLCKTCVISHKRNCKENRIISLEKAHSELVTQISTKIGQINNFRSMADGEYSTIQKKLEDFNKGSEKIIDSIEQQFQELRDILDSKEAEIKSYFNGIFSQRKSILTKEIQSLENMNSKTESLIDIVEFAMSYPNSYFSEGAKYLVHRLNRLNQHVPKIESARATQIPNFDLGNLENCKIALEQLSLREIREISQNKVFSARSKSIAIRDGAVACPDTLNNPLSPRLENYSILQEAKKKIAHMKKSSLTSSSSSLVPVQKTSSSPDAKRLSSQRSFTQLPLKMNSYRSLLSKLGSFKEQKENILAKTEVTQPQPRKLSKERTPTSASTLTHSRRPSKSPNYNSNCLKTWAESPKVRITSSEDLGWTLCLSPHSKEENTMMSEEDMQLIAEVRRDPLVRRKFLKISQTANSIFIAWQHCSEITNVTYQLDYGVGSKVQNIEQFRTAFRGAGNSFIITGLLPKTKYRLRVCPILSKENSIEEGLNSDESTTEETVGSWSDVISVTTKDLQAIDTASLGAHATTSLQGKESVVDFEKSGRVIAKNEYEFGKVAWEIKIPQQIAHQSPVDSNSFIKVGVTNKNGKTYNIIGSLINYGLSTDSMVIKVFLDVDNRTMTVYTSHNKTKEVINNLPSGPLYPVFQNKTSKDSNFPLRLNVKFDLPYTPNDMKELE